MDDIQYFLGSWKAKAKDPRTGQKHTLPYTVEPVLDGAWLAGSGESVETGVKMHDLWGHDPVSGEILRVIFDSRGTYATVRSQGWDGDKLVLEGNSRGEKGEIRVRETITRLSSSEFKAVWEAYLDQDWITYSVETVSRLFHHNG